MKRSRPARFLAAFLMVVVSLAAFVFLDWYPTVKELGRLRRERSDWERKTKEYSTLTADFVFPDEEEEKRFRTVAADFSRGLKRVENDAAWLVEETAELRGQIERDKVAGAMLLVSVAPGGGVEPGISLGGRKLDEECPSGRLPDIREALSAASPVHLPWKNSFRDSDIALSELVASRPLAIVLAAPPRQVMNFVNHVSWGEARLEIVRLHLELEPGSTLCRAWLVCRGHYSIRKPSVWSVQASENGEEELRIDPDSPLLLQRIDPLLVPRTERRELPASGSPW